jgi:O2-independent ubiquinone biosynthesis accessory factor UbiT
MNPLLDRTVPAGMPAVLVPLHLRLRSLVARLPVAPPSLLAARLLDRALLPRLPQDARRLLEGHCVELVVTDFGLRVRLHITPAGFAGAGEGSEAALRIAATAANYLRLLRGEDDPDRMFFERTLVMEGDTELGLVLKNTLDAIGPLWPRRH